jgi:hypothetical protein
MRGGGNADGAAQPVVLGLEDGPRLGMVVVPVLLLFLQRSSQSAVEEHDTA